MIELGRACVHREHRNFNLLHLLWRGIAQYAVARQGALPHWLQFPDLAGSAGRRGDVSSNLRRKSLVRPEWQTVPQPIFGFPVSIPPGQRHGYSAKAPSRLSGDRREDLRTARDRPRVRHDRFPHPARSSRAAVNCARAFPEMNAAAVVAGIAAPSRDQRGQVAGRDQAFSTTALFVAGRAFCVLFFSGIALLQSALRFPCSPAKRGCACGLAASLVPLCLPSSSDFA